MTDITIRAAGVTHASGYPQNLIDLSGCLTVAPEPLDLVRKPDNARDPFAVAIEWRGRHLGWIPSSLAPRFAGHMDRGWTPTAEAQYVAVHLEHRERPGLSILVRDVP